MPRRQSPIVIRQQADLIRQELSRVVSADADAEIATAWFQYCYLMARDVGRPFALEAAILAECQRLDPSVTALDEVIDGTSEETGARLAATLQEKKSPLAHAFGANLCHFLFVAAQINLNMMTEWPAWLPYGQVRLLPDNPLWKDRDGHIHGAETARPEHFTQLGEVLDWNRGGQPSMGRP